MEESAICIGLQFRTRVHGAIPQGHLVPSEGSRGTGGGGCGPASLAADAAACLRTPFTNGSGTWREGKRKAWLGDPAGREGPRVSFKWGGLPR